MENNPVLLALVGVVIGVTEVVKKTNLIPERFIPLFALILGALFGFLQHVGFIESLMIGLSANGLYSGVKRTME